MEEPIENNSQTGPIRRLIERYWRAAVITGFVFMSICAIYTAWMYRQLEDAFHKKSEYIPTRIYSDVTYLRMGMKRNYVEGRLKSLGYRPAIDSEGLRVSFKLHALDYPSYLIPPDHPTREAVEKQVSLNFNGTQGGALLASIHLGDEELPELILEPELVATLSRAGSDQSTVREYVVFQDIPSPVWKAIMAAEDQHFLDHVGLDPKGLIRAFLVNLVHLSFKQGGSTITQQLVKNLTLRRDKNLFRKFNEIFLAVLLEMKFDKTDILERYLNEVYLGQIGSLEVHGVAEGARYYFGKTLGELNTAEIAMLAGLIRGPWYYSPYRHFERALERQQWVLQKMVETGHIAQEEANEAKNMPIRLAPPPTASNKAPYFVDYTKAELIKRLEGRVAETEISDLGFRVYTTLDPVLNRLAQESVATGITRLEAQFGITDVGLLEGALVSVDPANGFVRALVGGKSYSRSTFNRILNMTRQVGSTFKPIVYLAALQRGEDDNGIPYGPGYPVLDQSWTYSFDQGRQSWSPVNYDKEFRGWISMKDSLANSVNVTTAKLGISIGLSNIAKLAHILGAPDKLPEVPSLTLGIAEMSPVEVALMYNTLANRGVKQEMTVIRGIAENNGSDYARFPTASEKALDSAQADLLTDMLTEVFKTGTAKSAAAWGFKYAAAGKTGTTSNHRDAWFAGYTPQLTTVVWAGLDAGGSEQSKVPLTGAGSALPIWIEFMKGALSGLNEEQFPLPDDLNTVRVDRHTGQKAKEDCPDAQVTVEKYLKSFTPDEETCAPEWPKET